MLSTIDITEFADSQIIEPAILYFGTPVVLIGSSNEDGSSNLAPMSSAWWVGWRCMLGLASNSKTTENMLRTGECVLNLPSANLVDAVNRLARTTGSNPLPAGKIKRGYRHEKNKFEISSLTPLLSTAFLIMAGFAEPSASLAIAAVLIAGGGLIAAKDMLRRKTSISDAQQR